MKDYADMLHELKISPEYFIAITKGAKRFEIRKNERNFKPHDYLYLREYDPRPKFGYRGGECVVKINYTSIYEQKDGFIVLGISDPI